MITLLAFIAGIVVGGVLGYLLKRNSPQTSQMIEGEYKDLKDKIK